MCCAAQTHACMNAHTQGHTSKRGTSFLGRGGGDETVAIMINSARFGPPERPVGRTAARGPSTTYSAGRTCLGRVIFFRSTTLITKSCLADEPIMIRPHVEPSAGRFSELSSSYNYTSMYAPSAERFIGQRVMSVAHPQN